MSGPRDPDEARDAFVRSTALDPEAAGRLRQRLGPWLGGEEVRQARDAYLLETLPPQAALARLRGRLGAAIHRPPAARWLPEGGLGLAGAAGAAAGVVLGIVWLVARLSGAPDAALVATDGLSLPLDDVSLSFAGEGKIGGTERAPVIDWQSGRLSVAVTPKRGIDLTVSTPEAVVRVVGTVFVVDRSLGATVVEVAEGTVRVTCSGLPEVEIHGGGSHACLSADVSARVERLVALSGASPSERLAAIDDVLALAGDNEPLVNEILAHRVRALADAGRTEEAVATAERILGSAATARRAELAGFVARSRFAREGCTAGSSLERAIGADPAAPEGLLLATCLVRSDPERARALLAAAAPSATGELREVAERLAEALGEAP